MGARVAAGILLLAALAGCAHGKAFLEPASGSYFGVSVDFSKWNVQQYLQTAGVQPVIWNVFVSLPLNGTTKGYLQQTLPQIAAAKGIVLLSVEPDQGLPAVTAAAVSELAAIITYYQQSGASFMIRYAHEMNGNWYVWGQQPAAYIASHKLVASVLRNSTCGVAMVWAPNSATGYPWAGGFQAGTALSPQPQAGSADFKAMDTNGDGQITSADDPYAPFYPGDAWIDWVGMSSFHFGGQVFPFTLNQQAAPQAFTNGFTGAGASPPIPNFYTSYAADGVHNKPMVITETSAMYNPSNPNGQTDYTIKSNWWQQVFNVQGDNANALDMSVHFPAVKAVMWFDELKVEAQAGGAQIDWRFTGNQQIASGLAIYLSQPAASTGQKYWKQLPDFTAGGANASCSAPKAAAPSTTPTSTPAATPAATTAAARSPPPAATSAAPPPPTQQSPPPPAQQSVASTATFSAVSGAPPPPANAALATLAGIMQVGRRLLRQA